MMEQPQAPPREQRFDLQQMLRELAFETAGGSTPMPGAAPPSRSAASLQGHLQTRAASPETARGDGHG
ncbi:hypothetical protein DW355_09940 [Hylemonella gracilis]|uniref:Uncharacterized protein n=1 Tax=Hylemonella gracilis TaxID=80880 RepID=A0A4V1A273_9BURK|nr:hypothetical protein [Hylemonella gracilis]QBK05049.1 hypothetical protein DW355_09940 [Hylemonella gracilis]